VLSSGKGLGTVNSGIGGVRGRRGGGVEKVSGVTRTLKIPIVTNLGKEILEVKGTKVQTTKYELSRGIKKRFLQCKNTRGAINGNQWHGE